MGHIYGIGDVRSVRVDREVGRFGLFTRTSMLLCRVTAFIHTLCCPCLRACGHRAYLLFLLCSRLWCACVVAAKCDPMHVRPSCHALFRGVGGPPGWFVFVWRYVAVFPLVHTTPTALVTYQLCVQTGGWGGWACSLVQVRCCALSLPFAIPCFARTCACVGTGHRAYLLFFLCPGLRCQCIAAAVCAQVYVRPSYHASCRGAGGPLFLVCSRARCVLVVVSGGVRFSPLFGVHVIPYFFPR